MARHVAQIIIHIVFASISVSIIASQAERSREISSSERQMSTADRDRAGFDSLAEKVSIAWHCFLDAERGAAEGGRREEEEEGLVKESAGALPRHARVETMRARSRDASGGFAEQTCGIETER